MAVQFSDEKEKQEAEQFSYLGLPKPKVAKIARQEPGTVPPEEETPKKKGSALPLLVGAAAVVFLMAKR